jgi:hypothetical protein
MALNRLFTGGSRRILCSADCLTLITDPDELQGWIEVPGLATDFCVHCWGCGGCVSRPPNCLLHDGTCPEWSFLARAVALGFVEHYHFLTEFSAIGDSTWQLAAGLSETNLYLEGYELAELVVPQNHDD